MFSGCVGAIDGLCVKIRKPRLSETKFPAQYMNRKGFFAYNVQAIADADYIFRHVSIETSGSTHDWTAWQHSGLFRELEERGLPGNFWIAGDDAYVCSEYLLTPFPGRNLGRKKDVFNYFQSNCRIHVEQAFGILVRRWGILWRKLECAMSRWKEIIVCCMKLHNICMMARVSYTSPLGRMLKFGLSNTTGDENDKVDSVCPTFNNRSLQDVEENRHRSRESSNLRVELTEVLFLGGYRRPGYSNYSVE
ncbi:MAG: transposase family protein [bacterium]